MPAILRILSTNRTIPLTKAEYTIGRGSHCDIPITQKEAGPGYSYLSRPHAKLLFINGEWRIANLSQKNPTIVNGQNIGDSEIPLHSGDTIELPATRILFENAESGTQLISGEFEVKS